MQNFNFIDKKLHKNLGNIDLHVGNTVMENFCILIKENIVDIIDKKNL